MTYIGFKYNHVLVLLVLILLTVNVESSTYGSLQKRQEPPPPPETPNPNLCRGCLLICCLDISICVEEPNPDQCEGKFKNCSNDCILGDCKMVAFDFKCEPQYITPNQKLCDECLLNCCMDFKVCAKRLNPDQCKSKNENCVNNCNLKDCKRALNYITGKCKAVPVKPIPITTCSTPNDPICFPPGVVPLTKIITKEGIETPTPVSNNAKLITTESTLTSYFAGYTITNYLGSPTSILPSTLYEVKSIAVTEPTLKMTIVSDSTTILYDFNTHDLWGVTISLVIIIATLVFMVLA